MCGILALLMANKDDFVNQLLFDGLTVLQHRGQDSAGIVTSESGRLNLRKDNGLVKDVFQAHHMLDLRGHVGLGHVRYPTAGTSSCAEAQPLYTNYPYGICVAHNGNLTNTGELSEKVRENFQRHINTDSDSELLLNIFAEAMASNSPTTNAAALNPTGATTEMVDAIFQSIQTVMSECSGGYAGLYLINGIGIVGFRDPHGIRPIVFGSRKPHSLPVEGGGIRDYVMASESVAIDTLGFDLVRDVKPGEAIFVDYHGNFHSRRCHRDASLAPCIFEYVYFARPDSIMDGVSVYESRLMMGEKLAHRIMKVHPDHDIDVVIPIPDTSRTSALQAAYILGRPFREGFIKNRYIARTFIMPHQPTRKKSVRLKLNTIKSEFTGRNVLLVDDSVVRGTTATEIIQMARDAGARDVYFASAAPAIRYPNIYGIDIPTREELVAYERGEEEIAKTLGCNWIVYQECDDLEEAVKSSASPSLPLSQFDTSCFNGKYVTGETIDSEYFQTLYMHRNESAKEIRKSSVNNLITAAAAGQGACESVHNDKRETEDGQKGCEAI